MLHTPPTRRNWKSEPSILTSYTSEATSTAPNSLSDGPKSDSSSSNLSLSQGGNETLNLEDNDLKVSSALSGPRGDDVIIEVYEAPSLSDLPMGLLELYEAFLRELKEPRFERALAVCEISDLFQSFYQRFHVKVIDFMDSETQIELTDAASSKSAIYYRYNLLIERLLCETFYHQISTPSKGIPIDEFEKKVNSQFSNKLEQLSNLDIHFANLDIELPAEIENDFVNEISNKILPQFELLITEQSATLKMKHLIKIHQLLGEIIKELTISVGMHYVLNTDIYLPVLIFSVMKIPDLCHHMLVTQLLIIKRFANEFIFQYDDDLLHEERGKLLYVSANFEACISYISSVTLANLNIDPHTISSVKDSSPTNMLQIIDSNVGLDLIDDEVEDFKKHNPPLSNVANTSWVDYSRLTIPESMLHSDQGLKSISNAVDTSIRNIMGRVPWLSSGSNDDVQANANTDGEIFSDSLIQQLEENTAFKDKNDNVTPTSSFSSTGNGANAPDTVAGTKTPFPNDDSNGAESSQTCEGETTIKRSASTQERLMSKLSTSVGGVMKNLRPLSTSSSSTSLNAPDGTANGKTVSPIKMRQQQNTQATNPGTMRSRTTSFISTSIFGSPTSNASYLGSHESLNTDRGHQRTNSLLGALETAISASRSRGNSIPTTKKPIEEDESSVLKELLRLKQFQAPFESLTVAELREVYDNYQFVMSKISRL